MRLSSSSSLILATLASSSSLSVLAAPTELNDQQVHAAPSIFDSDSGSNPLSSLPTFIARGVPSLERRQALLDPVFGLTDAAGLKGIISTVLGLLGLQRKDAVNAESSNLTPDQVSHLQSMIKDMTGGLPLPLPVDSVPNLLETHAAFAFDAAPNSSTASASSVYSSATPTFSSTMYAGAEAVPTPPSLPVSLPVGSLPLPTSSPALPANPPNTPVPFPPAPAPLAGGLPLFSQVSAEAATDPSSTSASPNFGPFPSTNATSSSVPSSTATPY